MIYDNNNSRRVVSQLAAMTTTLYKMTIAIWILIFGSLVTVVVAFFARDYWWLGGLIGILLGYGFGIYLASVLNLVIEWMVQMLIAQGEILDRLKKFP
jgi:hypothetical protein